MASTADVVTAIRELTTTKQLERTELIDLLKDGLHAALVKRYGPNVRAEIGIDELKGTIRIVVLKTVVETVEDSGTQVALEEARFEETPKGPRLILSRGDPMFVKALFKLEVPEIQQGIVEIRATARESGSRTKIAVSSRDDGIDPVGACVGLKGSRVQAVVNELGGERIDIVPWSPDPERFAKLSLAPARVARVFSDPETKTIQAIVDEDQLSLAIGRNGQNVRLASELTGWKIDLYSSREWLERGGEGPLFAPLPPEEEAATKVSLRELKGLPVELVDVLERAGKKTLQDILDLEREDVDKIAGMTAELADKLMTFLNEMMEEGGEEEAGPAVEPPAGGDTSAQPA